MNVISGQMNASIGLLIVSRRGLFHWLRAIRAPRLRRPLNHRI